MSLRKPIELLVFEGTSTMTPYQSLSSYVSTRDDIEVVSIMPALYPEIAYFLYYRKK